MFKKILTTTLLATTALVAVQPAQAGLADQYNTQQSQEAQHVAFTNHMCSILEPLTNYQANNVNSAQFPDNGPTTIATGRNYRVYNGSVYQIWNKRGHSDGTHCKFDNIGLLNTTITRYGGRDYNGVRYDNVFEYKMENGALVEYQSVGGNDVTRAVQYPRNHTYMANR